MAKDKANRPKARLPRGFADRTPAEIRATLELTETIRTVYERWGFEPVETPLVEYADALGKFLPDQDRPNEGVFAFQDDDEQWLSLRYDLTAPLARHVAENFERIPKPYKSYRAGWVFRNEKPGPGRFRQFMQFDADIVGSASPLADAEVAMMAADTMEALGFARGEYVIRVNSRTIIDTALSRIIPDEIDAHQKILILRALDKFDRLGAEGVRALLTVGRLDESGDETKGVGLSVTLANRIMRALGMWERQQHTEYVLSLKRAVHHALNKALEDPEPWIEPDTESNLFALDRIEREALGRVDVSENMDRQEAERLKNDRLAEIAALRVIAAAVESAGYGPDRIKIDPSVVRGLEYYTGAVFEAELTFDIADDAGRPMRFGSVGGGGRYDGLVGRFRGEDVPATGFSVGVSRLAAALAARRKGADAVTGPVVVTVMDRDAVGDYQALTAQLRAALNANGAVVPVEMYIGESGMKAQLKYADRRNAPCVIIQGSDERGRGVVQVKDLAAGKAAAAGIEDREAWVAARPAQVEVPATVEAIAAEVRRILG